MKSSGKHKRSKGKRGELEARDQVRKHWGFTDCIRAAQRDGQYGADLIGTPGLHIEVKRRAQIAALNWMRQAIEDCNRRTGIPVLIMREDRDKKWYAMVRLEDGRELANVLALGMLDED